MEDVDATPRKRPRINRACAACRRRKIKCDGTQPCKACITNDLICSYDDEERRRNGPEYIQALEKKVEELEGLLGHSFWSEDQQPASRHSSQLGHSRSSGFSSNGSPFQREIPRRQSSGPSSAEPSVKPSPLSLYHSHQTPSQSQPSRPPPDDDVLETMIGTTEKPSTPSDRFWGSFGGLSLLQRMRKLCNSVANIHHTSEDGDHVEDDFISAFDSLSPPESNVGSWDAFALLPSKDRLAKCIDITMDQACCLLHFIDRSAVENIIDHVYDIDSFDYTAEDRKCLALLFAILALGRRFETENKVKDADRMKNNVQRGMRYFRASRSMLDVADCHDITSLQTVLCLIIYLQASSMLSTCYSYICAAVAASLRLGLHSPDTLDDLPEEQRKVRRCIFSVINIMDTYVTTSLGLPRTLRDVDAELVVPLPRQSIQLSPLSSAPSDTVDVDLIATNAHAKLIHIMARVVDSNHPVTKPICQKNGFYGVEYRRITAIEEQLDEWYRSLPESLSLDTSGDTHTLRSQLLLRLAYAHVQMVLYRPFLHHAARSLRPYRELRYRAYACGSACVKAAMQAVWLAEALESRGLFNEANWFVAMIVSFAATTLMLFTLSNEGDETIKEEADAAERVKNLLARHSDRSLSAKRSSAFLQELSDAKKSGRKHPYSELSSHTDDPFRNEKESSSSGPAANNTQDTASNTEAQTGQEHTIQAMSYPRMHPYLDDMSNI